MVMAPAVASRVVVYEERSLYRNLLVVEGGGYRCITFGRIQAEQSCVELARPGRLALPYTRGLFAAFYATPRPRRILIVGLGGGVVPAAVRTAYPNVQIDSVELDPAVARVAKTHFGFREDARSRVFVDDGRMFVRKQRRAGMVYDIIMLDAMDKDYIPEHMLTREFLQEVRELMAPTGTLVANTFAGGALQRHEAATYQAVFGDVLDVDMESGNRIMMVGKAGLPAWTALEENARVLDAAFWPLGVESSDLLAKFKRQAPAGDARVLTDQFSPANLLMKYWRR